MAGWTALHIAAQENHLNIVKKLIEHDAKLEEVNRAGWTALHIAAYNNHLNIVKKTD